MKKIICLLCVLAMCCLTACDQTQKAEERASGFDGTTLYINTNGNTYQYERTKEESSGFTQKELLDSFETETDTEGVAWEVYSVEEYPDLSYVLVISGTNSSWVYCAADGAAEDTTGPSDSDNQQLENPLTSVEAEEIAVAQVGFTREEIADIVTHIGEYEEKECYSVRFSIGQKDYEFVIEAATGAILYP